MKKGLFIFLLGLFSILALEFAVRLTGVYKTQSEKGTGNFINSYIPQHAGWEYHQTPNATPFIRLPEFEYEHRYDRYGYRNDSVKNKYDVIAFGDSFTEGLGAPQDSTWTAIYASLTGKSVYNAGVLGSDPFYNFISLKKMLHLHPEEIIFYINFTEIFDIAVRGGFNRFQSDSTVSYLNPPRFYPLYIHSHLFRAIIHLGFGYDFMFYSNKNRTEKMLENLLLIKDAFIEINKICEHENVKLYVFVGPVPQEYYKNLDRRIDFKMIDPLADILNEIGIPTWNLRPDFETKLLSAEDWKAVSWQMDGHFNSRGYEILALLINDKISKAQSL